MPEELSFATRLALLDKAAKKLVERQHRVCWIENDEDGFTGWRWEKYKVKLQILCAANRYKDFVIAANRHASPIMLSIQDLVGLDVLKHYAGLKGEEQGFIDQYGNFYDREEAMVIYRASGKLFMDGDNGSRFLFSEDIC